MKRSDFWFMGLGAVQLFLFAQLVTFISGNMILLPALTSFSQPIPIIRFSLLMATLFIVFTNLGKLPKVIELSDSELPAALSQITMNSTIVLLCLFILYMLRGM